MITSTPEAAQRLGHLRRAHRDTPRFQDRLASFGRDADRAAVDLDGHEFENAKHRLHGLLLPAIAVAWPLEADAPATCKGSTPKPLERAHVRERCSSLSRDPVARLLASTSKVYSLP